MGPADTTVAQRLGEKRSFGQTRRVDAWWVQPLVVFLVLGAFVAYATWAAFQGSHYHWGPYLSPFYSPELFGDSPHAWFGPKPGWWPGWLPWSPAFLILWAPGGFRLTCYYYRGAYYKAFWADPPSCMVGEPRKSYRGERSFPLVLQNVHRYFLYLAIPFLFFLSYDVWKALWWETPGGGHELGVGALHREPPDLTLVDAEALAADRASEDLAAEAEPEDRHVVDDGVPEEADLADHERLRVVEGGELRA